MYSSFLIIALCCQSMVTYIEPIMVDYYLYLVAGQCVFVDHLTVFV